MLSGFFATKKPSTRSYETFDDLVAYLSHDQIKSLKLETYPTDNLDAIADMIHKGEWHKTCATTDFPIYALLALKAGKINGMEFSTSQLFYNTWTHPENTNNVKKIPVFTDKGEIAADAEKMIDDTMKLASASAQFAATTQITKLESMKKLFYRGLGSAEALLRLPFFNILDDATQKELTETIDLNQQNTPVLIDYVINQYQALLYQIQKFEGQLDWIISATRNEKKRFYELLKAMPASEQAFLLIPDSDLEKEQTVTYAINIGLHENALSRLILDNQPMLMIPSKGMMQAYLEATRDKNAVQLKSRFGLSPWSGLLTEMKRGSRDYIVCFEPLSALTPPDADGIPAPKGRGEHEKHDGHFHGVRFSDVEPNATRCFSAIAETLLASVAKLPETPFDLKTECIREIAKAFIDMEMTPYNRKYKRKEFIAASQKTLAPIKGPFAKLFQKKQSMMDEAILAGLNPFWLSIAVSCEKGISILKENPVAKTLDKNQSEAGITAAADDIADLMIKNENSWHEAYQFSLNAFNEYLLKLDKKYSGLHYFAIMFRAALERKAHGAVANKSLLDTCEMINSKESLLYRHRAKKIILAFIGRDVVSVLAVYGARPTMPLKKIIEEGLQRHLSTFTDKGSPLEKASPKLLPLLELFWRSLPTTVLDEYLLQSIQKNNNGLFLSLFLLSKSRVNEPLSSGKTMLQAAVLVGNQALVQFLVSQGAHTDISATKPTMRH